MVTTPLTLPAGSISFTPSPHGIATTATIPITGFMWRLRVNRPVPPGFGVGSILVTYQVTGANGAPGVVSSVSNPASQASVTVQPKPIRVRVRRNRIIYRGFVDLFVDYSAATVSGQYRGTITTTIDCQ